MSDKERKAGPPVEEEAPPSEAALGPVLAPDIEAALRGQAFPATPHDLVRRARANGADERVVDLLAGLAARRYTSLGDALRALDLLS